MEARAVTRAFPLEPADRSSRNPLSTRPSTETALTQSVGVARGILTRHASVAVYDMASMEKRVAESLGLRRVLAWLLAIFGGISLLLALVGIRSCDLRRSGGGCAGASADRRVVARTPRFTHRSAAGSALRVSHCRIAYAHPDMMPVSWLLRKNTRVFWAWTSAPRR